MSDARHAWDVTPAEARRIQERLRGRALLADDLGEVRLVAGVDVGMHRAHRLTRAAVAVLSWPDLEPVASAVEIAPTTFPYVPGLLSFREIPTILAAWERLERHPDLVLCDGQGYAHPRRFGLACHLGVLLDVPTVGVAKSRLIGEHNLLPGTRGARVPLHDRGERIGTVVRSRADVRPLYVSPGHRVSMEGAVRWTLSCVTRYRLPETTRAAHRLASVVPWEI